MDECKVYESRSAADTERIAYDLAGRLAPGDTVALFGSMGMGKTAFCRGFAKGMGYDGEVSSPTFAIVHEYRGGRLDIFHFDMYRVEDFDELYSTGFFEYLQAGGVVITEWSENIEAALPERYIRVDIERGDGDDDRIIKISKTG